jgi:DUF4097 and DUF4098 domain-containing protein YvlB
MTTPTTGTPGPLEIRISANSGSITVMGETRADVIADAAATVEQVSDGSVEVVPPNSSTSVRVHCPEGCDVVVGTRSGSVTLLGRLGAVRATTVSGSIKAEEVTSADLRAMSGSIAVGSCEGICRVQTKSGSVRVGAAGAAEVMIGSGSVEVDHVDGALLVRAISGSVHVGTGGRERVEVETMSGSITVSLPPDCHPDVRARSMSSRPRVEPLAGADCEVVVRTLSGKIVVRSA